MEKIIQINYQGRNISIEENAQLEFQQYENELKDYFLKEEGGEETFADLQYRMGEILEQKLAKGSIAITQSDIDELISTIGKPSDLSDHSFEDSNAQHKNQERKKLFRDSSKSGKVIAGVCSGIANYFAIDPIVVRLVFVLFTMFNVATLFKFNLGILAYIIFWAVLPTSDLKDTVTKRLFRNPKDKVLGGVCSGLGQFFNIDVWIVRTIFLAPILLGIISDRHSFGGMGMHFLGMSFYSLTMISYFALWFLVPLAKSSTDYMLLKGEPINIATIQHANSKNMISSSAHSGINAFLKVIAYIMIGSLALFTIPLIGSLFVGALFSHQIVDVILFSPLNKSLALCALVFILFLPIVWIIYGIIRRMGNYKRNKNLRIVYLTLHIFGWASFIFLISNLMRGNSTFVSKTERINIPTSSDTLFINTLNVDSTYSQNVVFEMNPFNSLIEQKPNFNLIKGVRFKKENTNESDFYVELDKSSFGKNNTFANENIRASNFEYRVNGNHFDMSSKISLSNKKPFHFQNVKVTIYVPENKTIVVSKQLLSQLKNSIRTNHKNFYFNFDINNKVKKDLVYTNLNESDIIRVTNSSSDMDEADEEAKKNAIEKKVKIEEARQELEQAKEQASRSIQEAKEALDKIKNDSI